MFTTLMLVSLMIGQDAEQNCQGGKCPAQNVDTYDWRDVPADHDQMALFRNGKQIGIYVLSAGDYFRRDGSAYPKAPLPTGIKPPSPRPPVEVVGPPAPPQELPNYGIDLDQINRSRSYAINGQLASRDDAHDALQGKLSDDSARLRVTVIGSPADCDKVQRDIDTHAAFKDLRSRIHVKCYAPDNPMVDVGFVKDGTPTIYCQTPGGKVLHRQDVYEGPEKLAEAVRKADPKYTPTADPNLNLDPLAKIKTLPVAVWVAGGALVVLLLTRKPAAVAKA